MHNGLHRLKSQHPLLNIICRSPPIKIEDIGSVHLRLRYPGREQEPVQLIRGDVKIDGSTIFISFSRATEAWPFMIENDSDYTATICQKARFSRSYCLPAYLCLSRIPAPRKSPLLTNPMSRIQSTPGQAFLTPGTSPLPGIRKSFCQSMVSAE